MLAVGNVLVHVHVHVYCRAMFVDRVAFHQKAILPLFTMDFTVVVQFSIFQFV